jgi:hypothetical protein
MLQKSDGALAKLFGQVIDEPFPKSQPYLYLAGDVLMHLHFDRKHNRDFEQESYLVGYVRACSMLRMIYQPLVICPLTKHRIGCGHISFGRK